MGVRVSTGPAEKVGQTGSFNDVMLRSVSLSLAGGVMTRLLKRPSAEPQEDIREEIDQLLQALRNQTRNEANQCGINKRENDLGLDRHADFRKAFPPPQLFCSISAGGCLRSHFFPFEVMMVFGGVRVAARIRARARASSPRWSFVSRVRMVPPLAVRRTRMNRRVVGPCPLAARP